MAPPPLVCVLGANPVTTAAVLACLNTADASALRRLHPTMAAAVAEVPWADMETVVKDAVRWRAALPAAVGLVLKKLPVKKAVLARVTSLSVGGTMDVAGLAALPPSLQSLRLWWGAPILWAWGGRTSEVPELGVKKLPPALRELRINYLKLAPDADFSHLRSLRLLHNAGTMCVLSAATIASLPPSLEELYVSYDGDCRVQNNGEWPAGASLAHLPRLRALYAARRAIDDATIAALPPSLAVLDVSKVSVFTAAVSFAHLPCLHTLMTRDTPIGDAALATLPSSLVSLDVSRCYDLTAGAVFPTLPALRVLDASDTHLSDAAIASLPTSLLELRKTDCLDVTPAADLSHLTALRVLHSSGTDVSHAARGCAAPADSVLRGLSNDVTSMALLPGGGLVATCNDEFVAMWQVNRGGEPLTKLIVCDSRANAIVALPDNRHVAVGVRWRDTGIGSVVVWDTHTSAMVGRSPTVTDTGVYPSPLAVLHDGTLVAACFDEVKVLDIHTRSVTATLEGHDDMFSYVSDLAVLSNGILASASSDGTIRLWDVGARKCVATLPEHAGTVYALAALPGGLLASVGLGAKVRLWDTARRTCIGILTGSTAPVTALATLPDGSVRVWDTRGAAAAGFAASDVSGVTMVTGRALAPSTMRARPDGRLAPGSRGCVRLGQPPAITMPPAST